MKDLAYAVTIIVGSTVLIGGVVGNRVAKHYGKSKLIGTLIGMTVGFAALPTYVRIKNKIEMSKIEKINENK
jgi:hypothetical protein